MISRLRTIAATLAAASLLSGCAFQVWETAFPDSVDPAATRGWRVSEVTVDVPDTLTVSNADVYLPMADIVWHGDRPGDRREQVAALIESAAQDATRPLSGPRRVRIDVTLERFHAISNIARRTLTDAGVHDIAFTAQVIDLRSGEALTPPVPIRADIEALTGPEAVEAEAEGLTQKVRLRAHLADVFAAWLGIGPDVRRSFMRIGQ